MKRLVFCLLLSGCASDTIPGEGQRGELDGGRSDDEEQSNDDDSERDPDDEESDGDGDDDDEEEGEPSDAGTDAGSQPEEDAGALDDRVRCGSKTCPRDGIKTARMGETPEGTFLIERAGVTYTGGFMNYMEIHLVGTIDGDYADLKVHAEIQLGLTPVLPPDTYTNGENNVWVNGHLYREGGGATCSDTYVSGSIELVVQKHLGMNAAKRGDPLALIGTLKITGKGWDLEAPFNITTLCDAFSSI